MITSSYLKDSRDTSDIPDTPGLELTAKPPDQRFGNDIVETDGIYRGIKISSAS